MYYVYVLESEKTGRHYTGSCEEVSERVCRHNAGHSKATRHGVPWRLVYSEALPTRAEACRRETELKSGKGREQLTRLLQ
jgi:putative endonuclease